jgi:uncharacterized protein (DUF58 family)
MRTSLLAGMTTRGICFLSAGGVAVILGFVLGERGLLSVGVALIALPLLAAVAARRGQYRLSTSRTITPARVPIGHTSTVTLRLENVSRIPTGLLLAEDEVPYALGSRPRYVLDKIERRGIRQLTYSLRSDRRGKFEIGPIRLRVADSFGLVELERSASGRTTFVVTPRVVTLSRTVISRTWAGEGEGRARLTSTAGEDDVIPREYRDGDELRRVHWRSTARYGELMVRREEQRWRNRATIFLDTRSRSHMGAGMASSFEAAVSAAASVGVHVAREGLTGQFVTDNATLRGGPLFADALLDSLAVIHSSASRNLDQAMAELRTAGGVVIAIVGRLSAPEARKLAACRSEGSQGLAILLDAATWAAEPQRVDPAATGSAAGSNGGAPAAVPDHAADPAASKWSAETAAAESILLNAGWRVTVLDAATPLAVAWQRLSRSGAPLNSRVWVVPGSAGPAALQGAGGAAPSGTAIAADGGAAS